MLIVVRLGCQIPIPFVNADAISEIMNHFANENFSFFSAITGGSMEKMSIFALNITPYITASIIMQLLTIAIPKLDELHKDGEEGRKKIAEITRYLTVGLALIESTAMVIGFGNQGIFDTETVKWAGMHNIRTWGVVITGILAMTAGSAVLRSRARRCSPRRTRRTGSSDPPRGQRWPETGLHCLRFFRAGCQGPAPPALAFPAPPSGYPDED